MTTYKDVEQQVPTRGVLQHKWALRISEAAPWEFPEAYIPRLNKDISPLQLPVPPTCHVARKVNLNTTGESSMIWAPASALFASSLVKIPLLFSGTYLAVLAQSPPNPPPQLDELKKYDGVKDTMLPPLIMRRSILVQTAVYWGNFVCESAVILAAQRSSALSPNILSILALHPAGVHHIRVTPVWLAGCAMMHIGSFIRLACYRALGKNFTWELSVKKDQPLVTSGPYAIVRHPSYVGALTIYLGVILTMFGPGSWFSECIGWDTWVSKLFTGACTSWALIVPALLMGRVKKEDEVLRKEFGAQWQAYAQRVPYKLFPFIY